MASDTKKCQTMINVAGQAVERMRSDMATILAVQSTFQTVNPSVVGTPLEGNLSTINTAINDLNAELDKAVWTQLIAAIVPSHNNKALD